MLTLLSTADYRRVRWKNGRGWTTELAARPANGEFDWRVSIAEVNADCEFSRFPGIDRSILVLRGEGMELRAGAEPARTLRVGGEPFAFPGDLPARVRLLGGPTRDFNVMTRRGVCEHVLSTRTLGEPLVLDRPAGSGWLIHVVRGRVGIDALHVAAEESVLAEPAVSAESPLGLRGAGVLVLVRLRALGRSPS